MLDWLVIAFGPLSVGLLVGFASCLQFAARYDIRVTEDKTRWSFRIDAPEQKQLRDIIKRIRRYYKRAEVQHNPEVVKLNAIANYFETETGAKLGRFLNLALKPITGVDFEFVKEAHSDNLSINTQGMEDLGNSALAKVMAQTD